jgi:flavodoxin
MVFLFIVMKIKIIFETQTGTTQYVAELMQAEFAKFGHTTDIHSIKYDGSDPKVAGYDVLLFGGPTYEDGKLEQTMQVFIAKTTLDLSTYKVAVFGLGNSFYPQFCFSADILSKWVEKNNGTLVTPVLKIDGFPDNTKPIQEWVKKVAESL